MYSLPARNTHAWWLETAGLSITTVLSGSRPMVTIKPTEHCFNTRPSNCRTSCGIAPSQNRPSPGGPETLPPTANHFHDDHRHVIRSAVVVGRRDQVVANPLRITQVDERVRQRRL